MQQSHFPYLIAVASLCTVLACGPARAEIEQQNLTCDNKPCVKWWPKIPAPTRWHAEPDESKEFGVSMFARDHATTDTRMYTYALRKSDMPKIRNLDDIIVRDKESHREGTAAEGKKFMTRSGMQLRSFLYSSPVDGRWEQAAYGEDDDFFVVFYITAGTLQELSKHTYDFEGFVGSYQGSTKSKDQKKSPSAEKSKP